jgi:hypothetical protein
MLAELAMPARVQIQRVLLRTLLKHGGVVKEFAAGEEVVDELADRECSPPLCGLWCLVLVRFDCGAKRFARCPLDTRARTARIRRPLLIE